MEEFSEKTLLEMYLHYCDECPSAHDFTCSYDKAKKCQKEKNKIIDEIVKRREN